ncbi:MAG: N-acetylmuramoyl-L-alanine amidase [Candidatus Rokubacteria bacterium]|nr:N-acetylmuramoyl-L-alanine amidase [Candidatus Rokubacteria bacterium]
MRRPMILLVLLTLAALLGASRAEARPVSVEVRAASGASLGRLVGTADDRIAYFPLQDVARLTRASLRPARDGSRATLALRGTSVVVRRESPIALVAGRTLALAGPVRVRQGVWWVPGDLLVRALPALLGEGVQIGAAPAPPPPAPPPVIARPASAPAQPVPAPARITPRGQAVAAVREAPALPERPAVRAEPPAPRAEPEPSGPSDSAPLKAGTLELRYRSYPTYTRVVLEGGAPFEPRLIEVEGALVVPLGRLAGAPPRGVRAVRDGLVASLELGEVRGGPALQVTFEREPASRRAYRLQDPPRLVLDFYRRAAPAPLPPGRVGLQTIVLDPGHGGDDAGAVGPGGLREKELTLDVARRVAALVREELGVTVQLTRTRDAFVPLRERTAFANRQKADLFVSIHVNAAPHATATGTESYFLSSEATDNAARAAAAFENRVIALEPGPRTGPRDLVRSILWDLTQSEFQQESSRLAEALQDSLERALRLPSRGVKQAPFYVLGGAAMPAVLVEIGFISNPQEERRLQDEGYRDRIARALAAGLATYKRRYDYKGGVVVQQ